MASRSSDVHDCSSCRMKDKKMERLLLTIEEVQAELVEARKQAAEATAAHFAASAQHKEALEQLADALEKEREDMAEELTKTAEDFARCVSESQSLSEQLQDERNRRVSIEARLFNSEKHNREVADSLRGIESELILARDRMKALALEKEKLEEDLTKMQASEETRQKEKKELEAALSLTRTNLNDLQAKHAGFAAAQEHERHIQPPLKTSTTSGGEASKDRMLLALEVQLEEAMSVMSTLQGERDSAVEHQASLQRQLTQLQSSKEALERERDVGDRARKEFAFREGERKGKELQELHDTFIMLRNESRRKAEEVEEGDVRLARLAEGCLQGLAGLERALAALAGREAVVSARERKYEQQYKQLRQTAHRGSWAGGDGAAAGAEAQMAGTGQGWGAEEMADPELMASGKKRRRAEERRAEESEIQMEHREGDSREGDGGSSEEKMTAEQSQTGKGHPQDRTEWEVRAAGEDGGGGAGVRPDGVLGVQGKAGGGGAALEFSRSLSPTEWERERGLQGARARAEDGGDDGGGEADDDLDWVEVPDWEGHPGGSSRFAATAAAAAAAEEEEEEEEARESTPLRLGSGLLSSLSPSVTVLSRSPAPSRRSLPSASPASAASTISSPPRPARPSTTPPPTPEDRLSASTLYHNGLAREQERAEEEEGAEEAVMTELSGLQVDDEDEEEEEEESWKRREVEEGRLEGYLSMLLNRLHLHWTGIRVDYNVARSLILVAEVVSGSPAHASGEICVGDVLASLGGQQLEGRAARALVESLDKAPRSRLDLGLRPQHSPGDVTTVTLLRPPAPPPSPSSMPPLRHRGSTGMPRPAGDGEEQELSPRERGQSITRMGGVILVGAGGRKKSPRGVEADGRLRDGSKGGRRSEELHGQAHADGAEGGVRRAPRDGEAVAADSDSDGAGNAGGGSNDFASKIKAWDARKRERIRRNVRPTAASGSDLRSI